MKPICVVVWIVCAFANIAAAQTSMNFADRRAVILDQPGIGVQLQNFSFENVYASSDFRLRTNLAWQNNGTKPITAFEVVILRYDPFNRPLPTGGRWLITGKNSADWSALNPGDSSTDGLVGFEEEPVLTSVVYVRAIRFRDGTVWMANIPAVEAAIHSKLPVLKQLGTL